MRKIKAILMIIASFLVVAPLYAQDITVIYTGQSHAALLPCHCPAAPNGGIPRRHTKIMELRKSLPNLLLLDSGSVFAGGKLDSSNKADDLNKERTKTYLEALKLMKYDAIAIGDEEFNFGDEFLLEMQEKYKIPFVSCNLKSDKISPFVIKKAGKTKVAIVGVTGLEAKTKSKLEIEEPIEAIKKTLADLKKENPGLIILLSQLGEEKDKEIASNIRGIDIIISGKYVSRQELLEKAGSVILLYPRWEARSLLRLDLKVKNAKIVAHKFSEVPLDNKIKDSPEMLSLLPQCMGDLDCRKAGFSGKCENPGQKNSRCIFEKAAEIPLTIIKPVDCRTCDIGKVVLYLQNKFPGLKATYLDDDAKRAKDLMRDLEIKMLPAFILEKATDKEPNFNQIEKLVDLKKDSYILKPSFTGISFFIDRPKIENKFDVFFSLRQKDIFKFLETLKKFSEKYKDAKPDIHFLAFEGPDGKFESTGGTFEIEEYLRAVCVKEIYPDKFLDYLICRTKNIESSWWDDCANKFGIETNKIKQCAQSEQAKQLLRDNIRLTQELNIFSIPSILLDNQEIVTGSSETRLEELEALIKK